MLKKSLINTKIRHFLKFFKIYFLMAASCKRCVTCAVQTNTIEIQIIWIFLQTFLEILNFFFIGGFLQTFCNSRASKVSNENFYLKIVEKSFLLTICDKKILKKVSKNFICIKLYPHASNFKLNELFAEFIMQLRQQKIS